MATGSSCPSQRPVSGLWRSTTPCAVAPATAIAYPTPLAGRIIFSPDRVVRWRAIPIHRRRLGISRCAVSVSMARRLVARLFGSGTSAGISPPATETPSGKLCRFDADRTHVALALDIDIH